MKRLLTIFLIPLLFLHFWTSGVSQAYAAMTDDNVTIFTPESVESAPIEAVKPLKSPTSPPKKGISKWWYVLILAAVAGGAAAAGGGSGGGGDSGGSSSGTGTGTSTVTW